MTNKDEALKLSLEGIEAEMNPAWDCSSYHPKLCQSITAIREVLGEK